VKSCPSVSVCIPVRNSIPYIGETLESVAAQTFNDFELIISDNFSVDKTADVIDAWRRTNPEITCFVVRPPRQMDLADHLLFVLTKARGSYVKLLMADDLLEPDCLGSQVSVLRDRPDISLVSGPRMVIAPDGTALFVNKSLRSGRSYTLKDDHSRIARKGINVVGEPSGVMYRHPSLLGADSQLLRSFPYVCDVALHLWSLQTGDLWYDSRPLSRFRVHGKASTMSGQGLILDELERLLSFFAKSRIETGLSYPGKARALLRLFARKFVYWWAEKFHPLRIS